MTPSHAPMGPHLPQSWTDEADAMWRGLTPAQREELHAERAELDMRFAAEASAADVRLQGLIDQAKALERKALPLLERAQQDNDASGAEDALKAA